MAVKNKTKNIKTNNSGSHSVEISRALLKDTQRTIERSAARFISIIAIVALGISFFAGMNATAPDMLDTARAYYSDVNLMDLCVQSTIGLDDNDVAALSSVEGVQCASGVKTVDGMLKVNGERLSDIDGSEYTVKAISLNINDAYNYHVGGQNLPSYMNRVTLLEGSWPTATNECLVDASRLSTPDAFQIGQTVSIESDSSDIFSKLNTTEFKIVGIIRSPLYVSYERGYTSEGSGKLGTFIYIPQECFKLDYYTQVYVKINGSERFKAYTDEYNAYIEPYKASLETIAGERLNTRAQELYNTYAPQVESGRKKYQTILGTIDEQLANAKKQVEQVKYYASYGDQLIAQAKTKYNDAAVNADSQINMAKLEQTTQYQQWQEKTKTYNELNALVEQYADAETKYNNALNTYNTAQSTVTTTQGLVETLTSAAAATRSAVDALNNKQDNSVSDVVDRLTDAAYNNDEIADIISNIKSLTAVGTAEEISAYMEPQLQSLEARLKIANASLAAAQNTLNEKKAQLDEAKVLVDRLNSLKKQLSVAKTALDQAEKELENAGAQIDSSEQTTINSLLELKTEISNLEIQVQLAKQKAATVDADYEKAVSEAYAQLDEAKYALEDGEAMLNSIETAKWIISDRYDHIKGYEEYEQTSNRMSALSIIFPWVFFIVAAMVCLNTMARMVEEDRVQIGTLKALGFENNQILMKYLIYSGSASFLGSILGSVLGFWLFPTAITVAYSILYDLPSVEISFRIIYALVGTVIAVGVTVLTAYFAVNKSLKINPSVLMRPKAPKDGARIFLEKFEGLWSRLNFSTKVTCRNVFRNKKRFIMAIAGVAGCTALLVAGFGLSDSISSVMTNQFESTDCVCKYDVQIVLKNEQDLTNGSSDVLENIQGRQEIADAMLTSMKVCRASGAKKNKELEVNLVIPQNPAELSKYVKLGSIRGNGYYTLGEQGCIITDKLADKLNLSIGNQISIKRDNAPDVAVTVTGIIENYTFHYIYISPTAYQNLFGENVTYNYVTAVMIDGLTNEQQANLAEQLMQKADINAVAFTSQTIESLGYIMTSLNYIVLIIIAAAALLAIIVLYNLSNINVNERFREIATLKVLGFNKGEVSAYTSHENWILAAIGTVIGLILGIPIHRIVISIAEVDVVRFGHSISFMSFVYAVILSLAFTAIVNLIMRRRLKKINMVESLKSVE